MNDNDKPAGGADAAYPPELERLEAGLADPRDGRQILRPFIEQQQQLVASPTTAARSPTFAGRVLLLLFLVLAALGGVRTTTSSVC